MKLFQFCLRSALSLNLCLLFTFSGSAQSSNQSDTTGSDPVEIPLATNVIKTDNPVASNGGEGGGEKPNPSEPSSEEEENPNQETPTEPPTGSIQVDREIYDGQLGEAIVSDPPNAIQLQEEFQAVEIQNYLGIELYGNNPPPEEIANSLSVLNRQTGKKTALIYISAVKNEIVTFAILPNATESQQSNNGSAKNNLPLKETPTVLNRVAIPRAILLETVKAFQEEVSDEFAVGDREYIKPSQQLYQWLIAPIEAQLKAQDIDILVFAMDTGLRAIPLSALHDGKQFLIEKYAVAIIPSFGLTDINYIDVRKRPILAMGASQFLDKVPLPAVPVELETAIETPRTGEKFLNEQFTIDNFKLKNQKERFSIIHLGTHAEFQPGDRDKSYIQFHDNRLSMSQLMQLSDELGWTTQSSPVELLVLSACQTALGDRQAELGFAGLAVAAGVKSVLASLWNVSDLGTLGLMSQFYQEYDTIPNKAEALRKAQLAMLQGRVRVKDGKMILENGEQILLPADFPKGNLDFSHPYYWASFTLIGNWN
jgi:CHAT domain-containing protein